MKLTAKEQAQATLRDVIEETGRPNGPRPGVLRAMLADLAQELDAIAELKRPRRETRAAVEAVIPDRAEVTD